MLLLKNETVEDTDTKSKEYHAKFPPPPSVRIENRNRSGEAIAIGSGELSIFGVGTVFRLERDARSMVK